MPDAPEGILVIHKPRGMTSHDVVQLTRNALGVRQIGHSGTLDPIAEGVLVLLVGKATKHQQAAQAHPKRYEAVMRLGTQTDTGDAWGNSIKTAPVPPLDRHHVEAVLASLVGPLSQVPPVFSAVKVRGRPLYWWARRGFPLTVPPRIVQIFAAELLDLSSDQLTCRVECSRGTYMRCLAELIAERLGTVGHVHQLIRLAVGPWDLSQAHTVDWLRSSTPQEIRASLTPVRHPTSCAPRSAIQ